MNETSGETDRVACSLELVTNSTAADAEGHFCVMTQLSHFLASQDLATPFFGVIFYFGNYLWLLGFALSLVVVLVACESGKYDRVEANPEDELDRGFEHLRA